MPQKDLESKQSCGGRLVSVEGRDLPLRSVGLCSDAQGGLARTVLRQVFANAYDEPLQVHYSMPLPAQGAVSGYAVRIGSRTIHGRVEPREAAREEFERALIEGRTGGLLDQERADLFTLELGNVPPHIEVTIELTVDHRLAWLPDGTWEWRFPTVVAPRYMGDPGRVGDADRVHMDVAEAPTQVHATLDLRVGDDRSGTVLSPSHPIRVEGTQVSLAEGGAQLDRDIVVRWAASGSEPGLALRCARSNAGSEPGDRAHALLTVVPPAVRVPSVHRDLVVLLDCSGSMHGRPLAQAKRIAASLVESLQDADTLELVAFSTAARRWKKNPERATRSSREAARRWIVAQEANGGTEMLDAVETALQPLREDAQRQVVLVTDGQVGFETEVLRAVCDRLPRGSRLHTVGIGSAVNRTLTAAAARAGRGTELIVGLDEDPWQATARLLASLCAPIVTELEITGSAVRARSPGRLPDLMAGAPVLVALEIDPSGGELIVRGLTPSGVWREDLQVAAVQPGSGSPALAALFARERVEDLEMELATGADPTRVEDEIRQLGLEYGIATRLTSWVAVSEEPDVDPRRPVRSERMPQMLPYGMSAEGLGLRAAPGMLGGAGPRDATFMLDLMTAANIQTCKLTGTLGPMVLGARKRGRQQGRWTRVGPKGPQVLEFEVGAKGLKWDPGDSVTLVLRDGRRKQVALDLQITTAPGRIGRHRIVRLALQIGLDEVFDVEEVEVQCREAKLQISV